MDGRQRLKLSLTNRSIGLILPSRMPARSGKPWTQRANTARTRTQTSSTSTKPAVPVRMVRVCLGDLVVMARLPTPDPIPNSAVKRLSADGTAS